MAVTNLTGTTWKLNSVIQPLNLLPTSPEIPTSGNRTYSRYYFNLDVTGTCTFTYGAGETYTYDITTLNSIYYSRAYNHYNSTHTQIGLNAGGLRSDGTTLPGILLYEERNDDYTYTFPNTVNISLRQSSPVVSNLSNITITGGSGATDSNIISWFEANATQVVSRKSIDLTTLPGWSSLSSGSHSITIVAKADGYRDSEPSAAVSVEKAAPVYTDCITFTGESSDFTLAVGSDGAKEWNGVVEYSTDHNTWTVWDGTAVSSVDKKLYLRGSGNTTFKTSSKGARLSLSARAACSGNIQTLLEYSNPPTSIPANSCYFYMFYNCTNLTTAPELPATTLMNFCYSNMFDKCTSLTTAPALPATTLAASCYYYMFRGCTSLITAPALPATILKNSCYSNMFDGCTSLTTAPELPATTLAAGCYYYMFNGCTLLKISATQSPEYPTVWRIPSSGTISSTYTNWNGSMLAGTGGTFTSNPSINTTYYGAWTSATPTLISFTIAGNSYQAEEGMTWAEWVESSYNTDGYFISLDNVFEINGGSRVSLSANSTYFVLSTDEITNDSTYFLSVSGGAGN